MPRKYPLRRIFCVLSAVIFVTCLAAAEDASRSPACAELGRPTNFDYLVLASIADSPRFLAMSGYDHCRVVPRLSSLGSLGWLQTQPAPTASLHYYYHH
jgi:hypothetical protein